VAATGLVGADGRVTGVRLDTGETIDAALVVDCTGRAARSDRWLAELGFAAPETEEVKINIRYSTRYYRRKDDPPAGRAILVLPSAPHGTVAGMAIPAEGDRWQIVVGGWHNDTPGADETAFREYLHRLPEPTIGQLVDECEPLTDIATHHYPASRRRYFEKMTALPVGYLALGDALCSFNPIYGQGMTVAALEAVALRRLLAGGAPVDAKLSRDFFAEASKLIVTPWRFAVGADLAYPQTEGRRPRGVKFINGYTTLLQRAAQSDPAIRRLFNEVQHLLKPPSVLQRPATVWRVLRAARRLNKNSTPRPASQ
jgi:flavin-dependent dehydrogenase